MKRIKKGVTVLEMVVGLMVVIPLVLILVDMILITLAVQINDSAAREAVRLAASGDPNQAASRAQLVISRINSSSAGYVSNIKMVSIVFSPPSLLTTAASLVPYGGAVEGSVTVKTQATVTPIFVSYVYTGPINFQSAQTCPITYNVPNTAGGQPVSP
jgi:hypothetical protein